MDDSTAQIDLIKLVVAWTLVGALIITVLITLASLPGWIKFANPKQQKALFGALVLELVVGCVGFFGQLLKFSPTEVRQEIEEPIREQLDLKNVRIADLSRSLEDVSNEIVGYDEKIAALQVERNRLVAKQEKILQELNKKAAEAEEVRRQMAKMASNFEEVREQLAQVEKAAVVIAQLKGQVAELEAALAEKEVLLANLRQRLDRSR